MILRWALGPYPDTALALTAWRLARRWLRRRLPVAWVIIHPERDPVYTGYGWTGQLLVRDHVRPSYPRRGCRDNPEAVCPEGLAAPRGLLAAGT